MRRRPSPPRPLDLRALDVLIGQPLGNLIDRAPFVPEAKEALLHVSMGLVPSRIGERVAAAEALRVLGRRVRRAA